MSIHFPGLSTRWKGSCQWRWFHENHLFGINVHLSLSISISIMTVFTENKAVTRARSNFNSFVQILRLRDWDEIENEVKAFELERDVRVLEAQKSDL